MIIFNDIAERRLIGRIDPRVRVLSVALFAIVVCLAKRPLVLSTALLAALCMLALSGVPLRPAVQRLGFLNIFMLMLLLTTPLFVPGQSALQIGRFHWSREGIQQSAWIAARANGVMLMTTALLGTMQAEHFGFALSNLGVPHKFAHLLLFMIRYIEIIHHEYHHLRNAMLLRAFRPHFDMHTFRTFGYLVGQLLVRSVNRAERIMDAMKCRGFCGRYHLLAQCHIDRADMIFGATALLCISLLGLIEWI